MSRISIIGVRTDHLVNAPPACPVCISFDLEGLTARSRPSPSWVDCITSIGVLHDGLYFCALQPFPHRMAPQRIVPRGAPECSPAVKPKIPLTLTLVALGVKLTSIAIGLRQP